jgi:hypothetical protein
MLKLKTIFHAVKNQVRRIIDTTFEPESEIGASRVNVAASNYTANAIINIVGGNFLTGLLLLLKADDMVMGSITMIGFIGNTLQALSPVIIERFEKRKKILIIGRGIYYLFNIAVISVLSVADINYQIRLSLIMVVMLFVSVLNAILAPALSIWHIKSIPDKNRIQYFSFFSITNGILQYVIILGASRLVDNFKENGNEMYGLQLLRIVAMLLAVLDLYFLSGIKEYPNISNKASISLKQILINPFKQKKYLISVFTACLWSFSANIPGPYYTIYMLKHLEVKYSYLNLINMLNIPLLILFTPLWSRRIRKTSWFKTLYFSMSIFLFHYFGLALVSGETLHYLYPLSMIFGFIFAPGINIVFSNLPYINLPESEQTNYIGFYSAMSNFAAFTGAFFGKKFIEITDGKTISVFNMVLQNKQYLLIFTAIMMALASYLIKKLQRLSDSG